MLKFDTSTIRDDVSNWTQTAEELNAWTVDEMKSELAGIFGTAGTIHENGEEVTLEELARLYTEAAHSIAEEMEQKGMIL